MSGDLVARRLADAEATIAKGLTTFVEVGNALRRIRDERLYADDYGTFESYCDQRWGFTDRRARQLMDSASIIGDLPTGTIVPLSEGQARELTGLDPETAAEVMDLAAESGKVTAASIRDARQIVQPTKPAEWSCDCGAAFKSPHTHCGTCGDHYPEPVHCPTHTVSVDTATGEILDEPREVPRQTLPEVPSQWRADAADRFLRMSKVALTIRDHMDALAEACANGSDLERRTWIGITRSLADHASALAYRVSQPTSLRSVK